MSNTYTAEAATKLRSVVAAIDQEIANAPPTAAMKTAWSELVGLLALGPAPATRVCPTCKGVGMRAASRCSNCWSALERLPDEEVSQ
jgi:hypothetical protein